MRELLEDWGPMTVLVFIVVVIIVLAGAVVTIVNPDQLTFELYLKYLVGAAGGAGLLGIGRGIRKQGLPEDKPPAKPGSRRAKRTASP